MSMHFLFVGERPSHQAVKIGATWQNGKLAGKQLRDALLSLNIDPDAHRYCNLYSGPEAGCVRDSLDLREALVNIWATYEADTVIVGMGALVCQQLALAGIPHLQMIHPAARGAIRRKDRYTAHVGSVLCVQQETR